MIMYSLLIISAAQAQTDSRHTKVFPLLSLQTCSEYLEVAQGQGRKWQRLLQHEREQRLRLEDMVEQLARQHSHLEQAAKDHQTPGGRAGGFAFIFIHFLNHISSVQP